MELPFTANMTGRSMNSVHQGTVTVLFSVISPPLVSNNLFCETQKLLGTYERWRQAYGGARVLWVDSPAGYKLNEILCTLEPVTRGKNERCTGTYICKHSQLHSTFAWVPAQARAYTRTLEMAVGKTLKAWKNCKNRAVMDTALSVSQNATQEY